MRTLIPKLQNMIRKAPVTSCRVNFDPRISMSNNMVTIICKLLTGATRPAFSSWYALLAAIYPMKEKKLTARIRSTPSKV